MKTAILLFAALSLSAQTVDLKSLDLLESKAKSDGVTTVNLPSVSVRHFEFGREGVYTDADLSAIRSQVRGSGWSKVIDVKEKKGRENTEIYIHGAGGKVTGVVILVGEPRELTVVNLLGPLDLEKLKGLKDILPK
jgi:uncharacterized protein DUF4252